jgi:hypothetical protein
LKVIGKRVISLNLKPVSALALAFYSVLTLNKSTFYEYIFVRPSPLLSSALPLARVILINYLTNEINTMVGSRNVVIDTGM